MEYLIIKVDDLKNKIEEHEDAQKKAFEDLNFKKFDYEYHTCLVLESIFQWAERVTIDDTTLQRINRSAGS